ncbi:SgcJ/EcaC family oxidoreductase [Nonomuraea sp. NPDC049625]|uniref:SgcJ/EcaC family oxidoreductase n=1 Tax=Nonomuraea sp. NPDC049625 TaxID=3155775 RepID=UPI0034163BAC
MSTEIVRLLARIAETWNSGDAEGYAGLFTEDADYITFFGQHLEGRQAIEEAHRELFKLDIKLEGGGGEPLIKPLTDDVALVIVGGGSSVNGAADPSRRSVITLTALRTAEGWRFASFQNTRVSAP